MAIADRLQRQTEVNPSMTAWVNPSRPEDAVLLRLFRWKPFAAKVGLGPSLLRASLLMLKARP
jgi:hypothetical protein